MLNQDKSNAILVLHAFSGDAHAAGWHKEDKDPGWWDDMVGPGKAFDTDQYFVICSNVIGGCKGSTGPSSLNAKTGKPYGLDFPLITIGDMIDCQLRLLKNLGIEKLLSVSGGSMGGMQVLSWMAKYPERLKSAIPIATAIKHSSQQIAFDEVGRQAIMADPDWNQGELLRQESPRQGSFGSAHGGPHHLHERRFHDREVWPAEENREFHPKNSPPISRWKATCGTGATTS